MGLAAFLVVIQSLMILVHWIVFRSMEHYFGLAGSAADFLWAGFLILSFAFLLSNISTRFFPGRLTRSLYFFASIWLGTVYFLFMGAVIIALLESLSSFLVQPMPVWVAPSIYGLAFLLSILGLVRSYDIRVMRETIALPNLPRHQCPRIQRPELRHPLANVLGLGVKLLSLAGWVKNP